MKRIFVFVLLVFILLPFIQSDLLEESTDVGVLMGLNEGQIVGQGIDFSQSSSQNNQGTCSTSECSVKLPDTARLTFAKEDAEININGNNFANIVSQEKSGHPSFIELDKEGNVVKADFTVDEKGGKYVFGNTEISAPPNSRVLFDEKTGIVIKTIEGAEFAENPKSRVLQYSQGNYLTTIDGNDYLLTDGSVVSGRLGFDNGQAFVSLDDKTVINGVEISSKKLNTNVFFDGQRHEGDYVSFGDNNFIIHFNKVESPIVNFKQNNPYLKIDEGDYVAMKSLPGSEIEIQNRDTLGLIPRVITKGDFIIDEDYKSIKIDSKETSFLRLYNSPKLSIATESFVSSTTSPVELFIFDDLGNLRDDSKIFVDNFNRFAFGVPIAVDEYFSSNDYHAFYDPKEKEQFMVSSRIQYNYPTEENILALTGKEIIFNRVPQGNRDLVLGRLRDYWETLTPETKDSLKSLEFSTNEVFGNNLPFGGAEQTLAYVLRREPTKIFFRDDNRLGLGTFVHEATHVHQNYLDSDEVLFNIPEDKKLLTERNFLLEQRIRYSLEEVDLKYDYEGGTCGIRFFPPCPAIKWEETEKAKVLKLKIDDFDKQLNSLYAKEKLIKENGFSGKWEKIIGGYSDTYYPGGKKIDWTILSMEDIQNMGFASRYGASNMPEDIAEFVRIIKTSPESLKEVINPSNLQYNLVYRQKIDLLHQYKFISDAEYNKVLKLAGVER